MELDLLNWWLCHRLCLSFQKTPLPLGLCGMRTPRSKSTGSLKSWDLTRLVGFVRCGAGSEDQWGGLSGPVHVLEPQGSNLYPAREGLMLRISSEKKEWVWTKWIFSWYYSIWVRHWWRLFYSFRNYIVVSLPIFSVKKRWLSILYQNIKKRPGTVKTNFAG
jgi:hypothetical protein